MGGAFGEPLDPDAALRAVVAGTGGSDVLVVLHQTYMNLSGTSVSALAR